VYAAADKTFCNLPLPNGTSNTLGSSIRGINKYSTYVESFGTATSKKDDSVQIFMASGHSTGSDLGVAFPVSVTSIDFSIVAHDSSDNNGFQFSKTHTFTNKNKT
jgi:hypothetical protein